MDVLEAISTRRSIRSYTGELISDENLKSILSAGFQAPSAHNAEPREFIVLRDEEILKKIPTFHPYTKMLPKAGCGILVCGNKEKQEETGFLVLDSGASMQNMLLAAHGLGLGAVWCGIYPIPELIEPISELLGLPEHIIPISIMVVGTKDKETNPIDRYNQDNIHYDKW